MRTNGNPNRFNHLRGKVRFGVCDICLMEYPESTLRIQDGRVTCPDEWERNGQDISRQDERDKASDRAAVIDAKHVDPMYARRTGMENPSYVTDFDPDPIPLTAGGAPVAVTLNGGRLNASGLTISYGDAEITDAVAPAWAADSVTLSLQASALCAPGDYDLTFNGDIVFPRVIAVRS